MKLSEMKTKQQKTQGQIKEEIDELSQCSSDELMQRLAGEIAKQKADGVFDYERLKNSIEQIKIYLPKQTYENMMDVIRTFK